MKSLAKFFNHDFNDGDFKLYDKNNNEVYFEDSHSYYWSKTKYNENDKLIYYENWVDGVLIDNRPSPN